MSTLREQMVHHMQLRGLSRNTQEAYVRAIRKLAEHYGVSPDQLTEEQVRKYLLYLKNKKMNRSIIKPTPTTEVSRITYIKTPPSWKALATCCILSSYSSFSLAWSCHAVRHCNVTKHLFFQPTTRAAVAS